MALLAQWHPSRSERAVGRYAATHWRAFFPRLVDQSACNRRVRDLHGVLAALGPAIARHVAHHLQVRVPYEVLDSLPVSVMARCRGVACQPQARRWGRAGLAIDSRGRRGSVRP